MHDSDVIVIVHEGELPHCPYCQMFTCAVGKKHFATKTCQTQAACVMECEWVARQAMKANNIVFDVNNDSIETVSEYK
jgi:tRNA(Ile2) C34 agmatinyltransferase TiaS